MARCSGSRPSSLVKASKVSKAESSAERIECPPRREVRA
jgi:hypothetical protein